MNSRQRWQQRPRISHSGGHEESSATYSNSPATRHAIHEPALKTSSELTSGADDPPPRGQEIPKKAGKKWFSRASSWLTGRFSLDNTPSKVTSKYSKSAENFGLRRSENQREEYDSTWEDEDEDEDDAKSSEHEHDSWRTPYRFSSAARDMQTYRHNYPGQNTMKVCGPMHNLAFYRGKMPSSDGVYIQEYLCDWKREYRQLESCHSFIQWLFPLQEAGLNYHAKQLTKAEIQYFLKCDVAKRNLLESYKLMLDFYGIKLSNEETGEVERASNWKERFDNLNRNTHNNLRITRILKCLGTLGYSHYQAPLVRFFLQETLIHGNLLNAKESVLSYFMFAVLDRTERKELVKFAYLNYDCQEEFIWCPKMIQMRWLKQPSAQPKHKSTECEDQ